MRGSTCRARGDYTTKQTTEQGVGVWFGPAGTSFYLWARQTVTGPNHSMGWLYRDETTIQLSPVWMTSMSRDHTTLAAAQTKRIRRFFYFRFLQKYIFDLEISRKYFYKKRK